MNELNEVIIKKETDMGRELFSKHFKFQMPSALCTTLHNLNDEAKNNNLVNVIKVD